MKKRQSIYRNSTVSDSLAGDDVAAGKHDDDNPNKDNNTARRLYSYSINIIMYSIFIYYH